MRQATLYHSPLGLAAAATPGTRAEAARIRAERAEAAARLSASRQRPPNSARSRRMQDLPPFSAPSATSTTRTLYETGSWGLAAAAIASAVGSLGDIISGGPQKRERAELAKLAAARAELEAVQTQQETQLLLQAASAERSGELPAWALPAAAAAAALWWASRGR